MRSGAQPLKPVRIACCSDKALELMTGPGQALGCVTPNETGCPGDEDSHVITSRIVKLPLLRSRRSEERPGPTSEDSVDLMPCRTHVPMALTWYAAE